MKNNICEICGGSVNREVRRIDGIDVCCLHASEKKWDEAKEQKVDFLEKNYAVMGND